MDDLEERLRSGGTPQKDGVMMTWERQCAEAADRIEALEAKLAVAREALEKVAAHCANTGYGNPIVNERIVDRCEETAKLALREINALTGGDND